MSGKRRPAGRPHPGARLRLSAALALLALLGLLAGCGGGPAASPAPTAAAAGDPGLGHVHGLGVDPADGMLYAATHTGLFAITAAGQAERIADRYQDTMGFLVVGPGEFLGSGHPDLAEDLPTRLGLIGSTDAGRTWHSLSLSGSADLHALRLADDRLYAYDAATGRLMSTDDRINWTTHAALPLNDFDIDPADARHLLAATPAGLQSSTDGGQTFQPVPAAPLLRLLAWVDPHLLYGADGNGDLWVSPDGGATWVWRNRLAGTPDALTAIGADELYLATESAIYASVDGGGAFTMRYPID
jgi:hypothetical protein